MRNSGGDLATAAVISGVIAGAATAATVMLRGARDSRSAVAPINATSHVAWGEEAARSEDTDIKHTALGAAIHTGAGVFWASIYEKVFGRYAEDGDLRTAFAGGAAVAALAYVTDYHLVPKRLTPGWEYRVSGRSLAYTYGVLALSLPLRALFSAKRKKLGRRASLPRRGASLP